MLGKEAVREIAERYAEEVKKVLAPVSIVLFGSYVNGNPHDCSDIDIAVIMHDYQGNWLEAHSLLFTLKCQVNLDIEPHLLDDTDDRLGFVDHVFKRANIFIEPPSLLNNRPAAHQSQLSAKRTNLVSRKENQDTSQLRASYARGRLRNSNNCCH